MAHHVASRGMYFSVFGALLVLTATTVAVTFFDLGRLNLIVALLIAFTKASLVVWFFMHVNHSSALTKVFVSLGLFWFVILLLFTFSDYLTRSWVGRPVGF